MIDYNIIGLVADGRDFFDSSPEVYIPLEFDNGLDCMIDLKRKTVVQEELPEGLAIVQGISRLPVIFGRGGLVN